jgi:hypothetical protein
MMGGAAMNLLLFHISTWTRFRLLAAFVRIVCTYRM